MTRAEPKEKPQGNASFPLKGGNLKGFKGLGVGELVTVVMKGKVRRISENSDDWDKTRSFSLSLTSCEIQQENRKTTLDDAIEKAAISSTV